MASPTQLSTQECTRRGWTFQIVEHYHHHARRRMDLFGFGDILALDGKPGSLIIQATTVTNISTRARKIEASGLAIEWLHAGNRIEVWGWAKHPISRGAKKQTWMLRVYNMKIEKPDSLLILPNDQDSVIKTIKHPGDRRTR